MTDTKMLQILIDGQRAIKEELLNEIKKVREEVKKVGSEVKKNSKRLDMIGSSVAFLEDDAPTRKEYDKLEKRVTVTEHQISSL